MTGMSSTRVGSVQPGCFGQFVQDNSPYPRIEQQRHAAAEADPWAVGGEEGKGKNSGIVF
jgi:hypothetical protein